MSEQTPAVTATQPEAAAKIEPPEPEAEPEARREPSAPGMVTLAATAPVTEVRIPPLEKGGETVVITQDGTEVTGEVAERAREAAARSGTLLRELR